MECISSLIFIGIMFLIIRAGAKKSQPVKKPDQPKTSYTTQSRPSAAPGQSKAYQRPAKPQQKNVNKPPVKTQQKNENKQSVKPQSTKMPGTSGKEDNSQKPEAVRMVEQVTPANPDLLAEINDLMVKGYTGNLTFERDFVSEGIEMLNRFDT